MCRKHRPFKTTALPNPNSSSPSPCAFPNGCPGRTRNGPALQPTIGGAIQAAAAKGVASTCR